MADVYALHGAGEGFPTYELLQQAAEAARAGAGLLLRRLVTGSDSAPGLGGMTVYEEEIPAEDPEEVKVRDGVKDDTIQLRGSEADA